MDKWMYEQHETIDLTASLPSIDNDGLFVFTENPTPDALSDAESESHMLVWLIRTSAGIDKDDLVEREIKERHLWASAHMAAFYTTISGYTIKEFKTWFLKAFKDKTIWPVPSGHKTTLHPDPLNVVPNRED